MDFESRKFGILDSLSEKNKRKEKLYLKRFCLYLKNHCQHLPYIEEADWEFVRFKNPIQSDGFSCGAYVMYYIEQLVKSNVIELNFDVEQYKSNLYMRILHYSTDMYLTCLGCTGYLLLTPGNEEVGDTVCCDGCQRWFHVYKYNCLALPDNIPRDTKVLEPIPVFCKLCLIYLQGK